MTIETLAAQHSEATARVAKLADWLSAQTAQSQAIVAAAANRADPRIVEIGKAEFDRLQTATEFVEAAVQEQARIALRMRLVEWAKEHVTVELAQLMLDDEPTATGMTQVLLGVYAIIAAQSPATEVANA